MSNKAKDSWIGQKEFLIASEVVKEFKDRLSPEGRKGIDSCDWQELVRSIVFKLIQVAEGTEK